MAKKKSKLRHFAIPLSLIIGLVALGAIWLMYDFKMMLRYLLGGIVFATVTVLLISIIKRRTKGKSVRLW